MKTNFKLLTGTVLCVTLSLFSCNENIENSDFSVNSIESIVNEMQRVANT